MNPTLKTAFVWSYHEDCFIYCFPNADTILIVKSNEDITCHFLCADVVFHDIFIAINKLILSRSDADAIQTCLK
jgi:hypothetical protein